MNPLKSLIQSIPLLLLLTVSGHNQESRSRLMSPVYPYTARIHDSISAMRLPLLQLPEKYRNRSLPVVVDNSQNIFWPGIKDQYMFYSCQQYCGVAYVFGYEINRLRNQTGWFWENSYPTHYTWNFMNNGDRFTGVNFLQSFEVIKQQGHMTSIDWGVDTTTSFLGWASGYDKYYRGMFNHLKQVYSIKINNADGINTLKNYLYDHLDGSPYGGIACFTTSSGTLYNMPVLPAGSAEDGKNVILYWQPDPVHGLTVVGYNDSIRYDLNNDGQYTNHLDINNDGLVDARDWEIGGFKIANSYGYWWSNDGFVYALYSSFARNFIEGGVWNNRIYVVEADTAYRPLLTLKVKLNYNSRNRIRILAGVSSDTLHQIPDHEINFPIFNFQGGDNLMQGVELLPDANTIEFGLDVTPLLNFVSAGEAARYFLMIEERDPDNLGQGVIQQASFINYQNGTHEFPVSEENVIIKDNNVTMVSAVGTMAKPIVQITSNSLPPVVATQPYQVQLMASGGKPPYNWSFNENYTKFPSNGAIPMITGASIQNHQEFKSYVAVALPFSFPFYGIKYDTIYVNDFGFVTFDPQYLPEPYITDEMNMLEMFASIIPSFSQQYTYQANDDGIWFQADTCRAIIRWKISVSGYVTNSVNDFALILFPDGQFEFRYGTMNNQGFLHTFYSGISKGDEQNFNLETQWNANDVSGKSYRFLPPVLPAGLSMGKEGLLSITAADSSQIYDIPIQVADAGKITDSKVLMLSGGLEIAHQLNSVAGNQLEFGSMATLKLTLNNTSTKPIQNLTLKIKSLDSLVQISDSLTTVELLQPGTPLTIDAAFSFGLYQRLPDDFPVIIAMQAQSGQQIWKKEMRFQVAGNNLVIASPRFWDGDNDILDPGEVGDLIVPVENYGSLQGYNLVLKLISHDTLVSILSESSIPIDRLGPYSKNDFHFQIGASCNTPGGHNALMKVELSDSSGIIVTNNFSLNLGKKPVALVNLAASKTSFLAMRKALDSLRVGYDTLTGLPFEYNRYQCIFLLLGISSQGSHSLTVNEATSLAGYLTNGGNLYMEGYHTWYYLNKTPLHPWFKYTTAKIPVYNYPSANGIQGTITDSMTFTNSGVQNLAVFSFVPVDPAYSTFVNSDNPAKNLEIVYDGDDYKTIGTFLDFGSLNGTTNSSSQQKLMERYLEFFELNITGPFPYFHAGNTMVCQNKSLSFTDDSFNNITSRNWEFEGGTPVTSTEANPAVVYMNTGKFDVRLTVSNGVQSKSILKKDYITVGNCTGFEEPSASPIFRIFPNPASENVTIEIDKKISGNCNLILFDFTGCKVMDLQRIVPSGNRISLDLSGLRKGLYFLRVQVGESNSTLKLIRN